MPKELKTGREIEELVMKQVVQARECAGCTGVSVVRLSDDRGAETWTIGAAFNASEVCMQRIAQIVRRLQRRYELKI